MNGKWSIRQLLDFSNIPSIAAALGGNFDPLIHLEQQRDFEDIIEAEQSDADLQPGRRHDPTNPLHQLSSSDSEDFNADTSQYLIARAFIENAQRTHNISSSEDSEMEVDDPVPCLPALSTSDECGPRCLSTNWGSTKATPHRSVVRSALEPEAGVEGVANTSLQNPEYFSRKRINYDTLELTDDEYLINVSDNESE